eukprot:2232435-Rhodomonas_salina.1
MASTPKDEQIVMILKQRVTDAVVDQYWAAIPEHQKILNWVYLSSEDRPRKKNSNPDYRLQLNIVYEVENRVASCIRFIAQRESITTLRELRYQTFKDNFLKIFPRSFWGQFPVKQDDTLSYDNAFEKLLQLHMGLYPFKEPQATDAYVQRIVDYEQRQNSHLTLPLR